MTSSSLRGALRRAHGAFLAELDLVPLRSLVEQPTGSLLLQLSVPRR
jgi:hypothetical protein